jgi:EmrB/QacA subfamily drug resistance transporter
MSEQTKQAANRWAVLTVVMVGSFMAVLDSVIVSVVLPEIMASLKTDLALIEWIITAFMIASAAVMPLVGWTGDRFGYDRVFMATLALFTVGSGLCALAPNAQFLIAARVAQGLGAGMSQSVSVAMISRAFEKEERGRALGLWGLGTMFGPLIGPTLGALLTQYFSWRAVFFVNVPVGLVTLLACLKVFAEREPAGPRAAFDWSGFFTLVTVLVCLLLGLDYAQDHGWGSRVNYFYFGVSAVALVLFLIRESRTESPIVPLSIFCSRDFSLSLFIILLRAILLFGFLFLMPVFLQNVRGLTAVQVGLSALPAGICLIIFMPVAGRLTDKFGASLPTFFGFALIALSYFCFDCLDPGSTMFQIMYPLVFRGAGLAFLITASTTAAMNAVEKKDTGTASSLINICAMAGGSLGIALLSTVLAHRTASHLLMQDPRLLERAQAVVSRISDMDSPPDIARAGLALMENKLAAVAAFDDVFLLCAVIAIAGFIPALLLASNPAKKGK